MIKEVDNRVIEAYGYKIDQHVKTKIDVYDERNEKISKGTIVKIVAIAPKVTYTSKKLIKSKPDIYDGKLYFINVTRLNDDVRARIHFITIEKIKK